MDTSEASEPPPPPAQRPAAPADEPAARQPQTQPPQLTQLSHSAQLGQVQAQLAHSAQLAQAQAQLAQTQAQLAQRARMMPQVPPLQPDSPPGGASGGDEQRPLWQSPAAAERAPLPVTSPAIQATP